MCSDLRLANWDAAVSEFLESRRALGRAYKKEEPILDSLRRFLVQQDACDLDQVLFDQWRARSGRRNLNTQAIHDQTVFKFCRYRRRSDPTCFMPVKEDLARGQPKALPMLIEPEQVERLLAHVSTLRPNSNSPLQPQTMRLAIVLLYTAGLRRGELIRLTLGDVQTRPGALWIRESKFHKSRWVPLSASAQEELQTYLEAHRQAGCDLTPGASLLCARRSRGYTGRSIYQALKRHLRDAGIRDEHGKSPRLHDFRHSFAVAALLRWYEADADVQANLPKLALFMGHVSIASTAYYLRWMPTVMVRASERFARACGDVVTGGAA
ncbi:tyrosine-type recombinase/integrase [Comamonas thiooxydans]|jgi:integrase|uniref:tyrosine-type recombinase/integrase n=1 Tax=Comamonas thiooxydans TaxID=363952 RepID=UPI00070AC407|nr:tyrosine-type recombinase/integrase [Comamonas thiooxydans]BCX53380.1 putative integrase/recombinase y4rB [Comamonas testosteroni]